MPHIVKEKHLDEICAQCKKPHGNSITIESSGHYFYETITCQHCGYEIFRKISSKTVTDWFRVR